MMSTAHVPAGIVPPHPAWRIMLWIVPLTGLWIALIYWQPVIPDSGVPTTAHQLMAHAFIAVGLWLGLESTDLTPNQRRATWLAIMITDTLWFAVVWSAAINGVFHLDASPRSVPWLPLAIFLPVMIGAPLLLLSKRVGQVLDAMPASWLIALQLYRVFGSWALAAWLRGVLPGVFALPAGTGDLLTGLSAVPAAIAVASGTAQGRRAAIAWNLFGLADFAVALTLGLITSPGRFQLIVPNVPGIGAGAYPNVLTPAFVVPGSILLHVLSLRQLIRRRAC
ncbi:MFS transporter [Paraburkholderia phymatum]|uniref:MFS transporter n=1 Tax=Paraburkholderia phymatum TaxID=148447 RepID=A0ACC6U3Y0_9BURK